MPRAAATGGHPLPVAAAHDRRLHLPSSPSVIPSLSRDQFRPRLRTRDHRWGYGFVFLVVLIFASPIHADVTGTVTIHGPPNSKDETFYARANGCGESPIRHTENWKIGPKGELQDVVVWIVKPSLPADQLTKIYPEVEIKQLGCRYVPHVIAVQAGVAFKVINGDPRPSTTSAPRPTTAPARRPAPTSSTSASPTRAR